MFTGLVEELGKVKNIARSNKSVRLTINASKVVEGVRLGDSIAVNGVCLTVVEFSDTWFTADVMPETVDRTALARLKSGDHVNLERTLRVGDRLGGHIVAGHVDGVGIITERTRLDNAIIVKVQAEQEVMRYIVSKGSISIDGTSLTIVDYGTDWFTVSLIPHTASHTTVGIKGVGDLVNLEVDMIGKYVERLLLLGSNNHRNTEKKNMSMEFLQRHGFTD